MARELAVVLANGSIQSAVVCALAAQKFRTVMLFAETGATSTRQGVAFDAMVQHFKPYRSHRLPLTFLSTIARNEPSVAAADPRSHQSATAILLDLLPIVPLAMRFAMHYGATALFCGVRVGSESADCAKVTEFSQLWAEMVQMTLERPELEVVTPLLELELWQVIDLGVQLDAPLQLTWSCDGNTSDPCGDCRSCRERDAAFQRSGRADPTRVRQKASA